MNSRSAVAALILLASCASKTRSYAREGSGKLPAAPSRADTLRARALAAATLNPIGKATLREGSGKMHYPIEAAQANEAGSVILAFIILPNGRIDRESRTIIYLEGHPIFAQVACDYLLEARVSVEPATGKPTFMTQAMSFAIRNQPKPQPVGTQLDEMMRRLRMGLFGKAQPERESWLAARPSCSALKTRDM